MSQKIKKQEQPSEETTISHISIHESHLGPAVNRSGPLPHGVPTVASNRLPAIRWSDQLLGRLLGERTASSSHNFRVTAKVKQLMWVETTHTKHQQKIRQKGAETLQSLVCMEGFCPCSLGQLTRESQVSEKSLLSPMELPIPCNHFPAPHTPSGHPAGLVRLDAEAAEGVQHSWP